MKEAYFLHRVLRYVLLHFFARAVFYCKINALCANNAQSLVTIYQYKPLVGVTSIFAPSGMETRYTYDEFNRLQTESIVEGSANVIHKYEYKYATENQ